MTQKQFSLVALAILCLFFTHKASGQIFRWVDRAGGTSTDVGTGIVADKVGNIYVTGYFNSIANFDSTHSLTSNGLTDAFIAKYNKLGGLLWVKQLGGTAADQGNAIAIAPDSGYIYVTGNYTGTLVFDSVTSLVAKGNTDVFIVKYDTAGNPQWAATQGTTGADNGNGIAVDKSGNVYVTGIDNQSNISISKYASSGSQSWYEDDKTASIGFGEAIAVDDSFNIYITGLYNDYAMAAKYDQNGKKKWLKTGGGGNGDEGYGITLDNSGNVYITGEFSTSGATYIDKTKVTSQGQEDIFLWKLSRGGITSMVKTAGGKYNDEGRSIAVSNVGEIYITGYNTGSALFDTTHVTGPNYSQIFIAKYTQAGSCKWVIEDGKATTTNIGHAVFVDDSSNVCVTGEFSSFGVFGPDTISTPSLLAPADIFVVKYNDVPTWDSASFSVNDTLECLSGNKFTFTSTSKTNSGKLSYLWEFGDGKTVAGTSVNASHSYGAGGFYNVTLVATTPNGYQDSIMHIIHVDQPNPGFYQIPGRGWGTDSFISYQWYIGGGKIIPGDTMRILTNPVKGNRYSIAVVDKNGCSNHSAAFTFNPMGISPVQYNPLAVYPNPTNGSFFIEKPSDAGRIENIAIYDMLGKSVNSETGNSSFSEDRIKIILSQKGIYIIRLQSEGAVYEQKIVVE